MPPFPYETRASLGEIRAGGDDEPDTYGGHFSRFWSVDSYATAFAAKAFRKTLADHRGRLAMAWFHDPTRIIGPITEAKEDKDGAWYRVKAVGDLGRMVLDNLRAGRDADVSHLGNSFGFWRVKDRAAEDDDPLDMSTAPKGVTRDDVRVITEVRVDEITTLPWTFAAQPKAVIEDVRARLGWDALIPLLDAVKAVPERRVLVEQIVAAWGDGTEPPADAPALIPVEARTNDPSGAHAWASFDLSAAAALARMRLTLTGVSP